jgi:hypothetical protein
VTGIAALGRVTGAAVLAAAIVYGGVGCARPDSAVATTPRIAAPMSSTVSTGGAVPAEFRAACGHPGRTVVVRHVPVTVRHADCDLTGVTIRYGLAGAMVPKPGDGAGTVVDVVAPTTEPTEIYVESAVGSGDVTVTG